MSPTLAILIAVLLGVVGQLMVKIGLNSLGVLDFSQGLLKTYVRVFSSPLVILGTVSYTSSVLFWLYSLSKVDLSYAYPFLALSYGLILLMSWLLLGEQVPLLRWAGVVVICAGVILISRS